jgi:hypothetical protein
MLAASSQRGQPLVRAVVGAVVRQEAVRRNGARRRGDGGEAGVDITASPPPTTRNSAGEGLVEGRKGAKSESGNRLPTQSPSIHPPSRGRTCSSRSCGRRPG